MQPRKLMPAGSMTAPFTTKPDKTQPTLSQFVVRADSATPDANPATILPTTTSENKQRSLPWDTTNIKPGKSLRTAIGNTDDNKGKGKSNKPGSVNIKQQIILSAEQLQVLKTVVDGGKNVFFTGSAGEAFRSSSCTHRSLAEMDADNLLIVRYR